MPRWGPRARRLVNDRIDEYGKQIDAIPLQNQVYEADQNAGEELYHIATAAEQAYYAASATRDIDADETPVHDKMDDAYFAACEALTEQIDQLVAKACAHVIQHADEWADRDADPDADVLNRRDREEYDAAKREAREWLQLHVDAAARAGVLEELEVRA